jgi:trk system potassium uptake protein TrkA
VAFIMRFGTGVLPEPSTVVQADDEIYVAALSGTITEVTAAAGQAPEESH